MSRSERQEIVLNWVTAAFGADHANSLPQRATRFLEEAFELFQAAGGDRVMAHRLLDYVFARPVGDIEQELGGVGTTLLALANSAGLDADRAEQKELQRVLSKPVAEFAKRNEEKNAAGFDAGAYPTIIWCGECKREVKSGCFLARCPMRGEPL